MSRLSFLLVLLIFMTATPILAKDESGLATDMLCAVISTLQCARGEECVPGTASDINVPTMLGVDLKKRQIHTLGGAPDERSTGIRTMVRLGEQLLLEGVDGGRPWSAVISINTGDMTATITEHNLAFVLFGECSLP